MGDHLEIRRLSESTGAEVIGFDFAKPSSQALKAEWRQALDTYQLLLFRNASGSSTGKASPDTSLDAADQVALLETLGPALIENPSGRTYQFVSNTHDEGILGDDRFAFHSDHAFMPDPIDFISLYGIEIPESKTRTYFANGLAAARALPAKLRTRIQNLQARHIIDPAAEAGAIPVRGPLLSDDLPHSYHPVLMPHPRTSEEILYISEQQTDRIESLEAEESRALIESLFDHLYTSRFMLTHEWEPGDLLVWDNRALQHARDPVTPGTSRTLRRVSIGGTSVYEFFAKNDKWGFD